MAEMNTKLDQFMLMNDHFEFKALGGGIKRRVLEVGSSPTSKSRALFLREGEN